MRVARLTLLLAAWERFWFHPVSSVPIALYRIAIGLTLLANALLTAPWLDDLFGPHGIVSHATNSHVLGGPALDFLELLPATPLALHVFFGVHVLAALGLMLGACTQASAIATFLTLVSLNHANAVVLNGADDVLRLATFLLVFAPCGEALSLDRWWQQRQGAAPPEPEAQPPWAQRLLQLQYNVMYLSAVGYKLQSPQWRAGEAIYYVLRQADYTRFTVPLLKENFLASQVVTYGVMATEVALATLVWWRPTRYYVLAAGIVMHAGVEWSLNIGLFGYAVVAGYILFMAPEDVCRAAQWARERAGWAAPGSHGLKAVPGGPAPSVHLDELDVEEAG